ncbi:MAG TPA: cell wall-binding repeat-containing protein, partial [Candidatus Limnocylindria bacterium]|nr:cell wall-binding repeat-containing protein [Candidatus Limnocylindria bacterium]
FELLTEATVTVPGGRAPVWAGKFTDRRDGSVHVVYRAADGAIGPNVRAERVAQAARSLPVLERKADAALRAAVAREAPDEPLPVAVWLSIDPALVTAAVNSVAAAHPDVAWVAGRPVVDDASRLRAIRAEVHRARADIYAQAADALRVEVERLGGSMALATSGAPLAFVDLPAGRVAALAERPAVASLGLEGRWEETMSTANTAVQGNWTTGVGDQGNGARVAVIEYHNVRATGDLSGQVVASYSTTGALSYQPGGFDHPSWVAGAIASLDPTYRGIAPGADIVSASTGGYVPSLATDRAVIAAADWAVSPSGGDADIVNTSLVQDTAQGAEEARRYFDSIAWEAGRLPVSSSGNYSALGTWTVGSPGTGWNVLTVGGTDDRGTGHWSDDRMWYTSTDGSSYIDPDGTRWNPHGDFNKPNVSAPAANVITANGHGASGTSAAAPIVSGIAAQLIARRPALMGWPEAVRAIVMAGAIHHSELATGQRSADREGVGTVSALWANRVLNTTGDGPYGGYRYGALTTADPLVQEVSVVAGQRIKVVVAWSSHTAGGDLTKADELRSDLDLQLVMPNGATVGSYSLDNSYEAVTATAPASGTARLIVRTARRTGTDPEPYALAWAKWTIGTQTRLAGRDRYDVSAGLSRTHFAAGRPVAYVASGETFPDALSAGPIASRQGGPVLLVRRDSIPDVIATELARLRPGRIVIAGGPATVSDRVMADLARYTAGGVTRVPGADRYQLAANLSASMYAPGAPLAFVATGENFPDALSVGSVAARRGAPILLTRPGGLPGATATELGRLRPTQIVILGGTGSVSDGVARQLAAYAGSGGVLRIGGSDRYDVSAGIAARYVTGPGDLYLATGATFPDALSAASPAGRSGAAVLLTKPAELPGPIRTQVLRLRPARIWVLGGTASVSTAVTAELQRLLGDP